MENRERIPVYPLDVYVLTDEGTQQIKGGSTALTPRALQVLVLVDGNANVGELGKRARTVPEPELTAIIREHVASGLLRRATLAEEEGLNFSYFFDPDATRFTPTAGDKASAETEAETGAPELARQGYYVSIARRADRERKLSEGQKLNVLVIEDEEHLAKLLRQLLAMEGFAARVAGNREEIVTELRSLPLPDLVLLDIILPDTNGFQILQRMKQHPRLKDIPVVMLTSQATRDSVMNGLAGGAAGYITKPFEVDILMKGVRAVVGLR